VSFIFGFENERQQGFTQVKSAAPCEGTSYEIGGIALVKGARHKAAAHQVLRLADEPGRPADRRARQFAAGAGQQNFQGPGRAASST
jgi:hypothetical protein